MGEVEGGSLENVLGQASAEKITTDRLWPVIIARVDEAARGGHDPQALITDAAWMLTGQDATVADHEMPTILMWNVVTLTSATPLDIETALSQDPQDEDLLAPHDAHDEAPQPVALSPLTEPDEPEDTSTRSTPKPSQSPPSSTTPTRSI